MICSFSTANYSFSGGFILQVKAITKNMDIFPGSFTYQFYATNFCFKLERKSSFHISSEQQTAIMSQYYKTAKGLCQRYLVVFTLIITLVLARRV